MRKINLNIKNEFVLSNIIKKVIISINIKKLTALSVLLTICVLPVFAARIKDVAVIQGSTSVQAIGYGLVTGLNNTGDNPQTYFTNQALTNMLKRFGLTVPDKNSRVRNVAAVIVTANIPTSLKTGSKVDVTISSIGDASSLQGGVLLYTPLSSSDGTVVGTAQGPLSVGGYDFSAYGSRVSKNVATTGRIPNGLILETDIPSNIIQNNRIRIVLREPDFTTASRIQAAVANLSGLNNSATILDASTVEVNLPSNATQNQRIQTISQIEVLNIVTDQVAKVVINERTGTVVVGGNVQLMPATVAHSGLEIVIQKQIIYPQPSPFYNYSYNDGTNHGYPPVILLPKQEGSETGDLSINEERNPAQPLVVQGGTVQDMANALNKLQVKPRDLIAIFQALKESGSLQAELVIQ